MLDLQPPPHAPHVRAPFQQIPIHNNGDVAWTLNAGPRQPPFGGPNQLIVPARGKVRRGMDIFTCLLQGRLTLCAAKKKAHCTLWLHASSTFTCLSCVFYGDGPLQLASSCSVWIVRDFSSAPEGREGGRRIALSRWSRRGHSPSPFKSEVRSNVPSVMHQWRRVTRSLSQEGTCVSSPVGFAVKNALLHRHSPALPNLATISCPWLYVCPAFAGNEDNINHNKQTPATTTTTTTPH